VIQIFQNFLRHSNYSDPYKYDSLDEHTFNPMYFHNYTTFPKSPTNYVSVYSNFRLNIHPFFKKFPGQAHFYHVVQHFGRSMHIFEYVRHFCTVQTSETGVGQCFLCASVTLCYSRFDKRWMFDSLGDAAFVDK
jgi:hypothetical protein